MPNSKHLWTTTIFLGIAFDFLFWDKVPGISFPIFIALILLSGILVLANADIRPNKRALGLILPIGFFATMTFLRSEPMTTFLNYTLTFVFMAFFALSFLGGRWFAYSLSDYAAGMFRLALSAVARPLSFINETRKEQDQAKSKSVFSQLLPVLRGAIFAIPILAIFAGLLSSADPIFAQRMEKFIKIFRIEKFPEYLFRGVLILFIAYILLGIFLYAAQKSQDKTLLGEEKPMLAPFFGFTESSIILGSVLFLFAAFVTVQFQYFFGGQANINIEGYTYAEYARQGFSELVTVAVFSLFLFLGLSSITRRNEKERKIFSSLGITLVLLVLVMLFAAFKRLALYEAAYGFSRLRTYPHFFMIWLGALLVTLVILEIRRKQRAFAPAMTIAIIGFALTLNLINVDAFIVRQNVARSAGTAKLDAAYLASLSDDAVPALANALEAKSVSPVTQESVAVSLICHWYQRDSRLKEPRLWQSFHLSDWEATQTYAAINPIAGYTTKKSGWRRFVTAPSGREYDCSDRYIWD